MAEHRIAIERNLGIQHQQLVAILAFAHSERVDFNLLGIGAQKRGIETRNHSLCLLGQITRQAKRLCNAAAMVRLKSGCWIDNDGVNLLGAVMRHVFDVHAAFG